MATKVESSTSCNLLVHEHEFLDQAREELRWLMKGCRSPERVAPMLAELADRLQAHFSHEEEAEGFFDTLIDQAPRLKAKADALIEEHAALSRELEKIQRHAQANVASADWWSSLSDEFDSFWQLFRRHERTENDLVQVAFNHDLGAED